MGIHPSPEYIQSTPDPSQKIWAIATDTEIITAESKVIIFESVSMAYNELVRVKEILSSRFQIAKGHKEFKC